MSKYNPAWTFPVAFPPHSMANVLAEWLARQGVKQSHIAGKSSCGVPLKRRNRKVCPRHVLLQRRCRKAVRQ